jgi:hypothetical protein
MPILQTAILLVLLPVCCFAPGFFLVRKLRWSALEKLCGGVGLSLILLYLAAWAIYCFSPRGAAMPVHVLPYALVSLVSIALGAAAWKDFALLVRNRAARRALYGYGFLLVWTFTLLAMIRVYSGAGWFGDWLEHFHRSLFFLYHYPANTPILPDYPVPSRPPMMNVLAAFFMAQTKESFALFQLVFAFVNLLLFLPCCLIMPALGTPGKRRTLLLLALFATSPVIMENSTYSWTKACAAFYVILAFWFYLAGWRKQDRVRTLAAFVALAAGLLVHYSAGPYVVFLAAHYLWRIFPKRADKWKELTAIAAACGVLLLTWFGWSLAVYGARATFLTNTSVTSSQEYKGSTVAKISLNLVDAIVPNLLRNPDALSILDQPSFAGFLRDRAFVFYQLNLIFNMGLVGGPLVLWLLYRTLRRRGGPPAGSAAPPNAKRNARRAAVRSTNRGTVKIRDVSRAAPSQERRFWMIAIAACVLLGIAVVGERDTIGAPHLTMLPLVALGLTLLAATVSWRKRTLAIVVMVGCLADFSLGVFLNARVESEENTPRETVYGAWVFQAGTFGQLQPPDSLSSGAWSNWFLKHYYALTGRWLEQLPRQYGTDPAFQSQWPLFRAGAEKRRLTLIGPWYGWWQRNGEARYFGDFVAGRDGSGTNAATAVLLLLFAGLMAALWRWRPHPPPPETASAAVRRKPARA